jgi:hypothetical protein
MALLLGNGRVLLKWTLKNVWDSSGSLSGPVANFSERGEKIEFYKGKEFKTSCLKMTPCHGIITA